MKSLFYTHENPNLQRNAFDLSERKIFSAPAGMLLPCFVKDVNPNEHFEIKVQSFLRTMPLNTASFARFKQNIDFFFVPYRLLYRQTGQVLTNTKFPYSDQDGSGDGKMLPKVSLRDILVTINDKGIAPNIRRDMMGFRLDYGMCRLLDLFGYGNWYQVAKDGVKAEYLPNFSDPYKFASDNPQMYQPYFNPFRLMAYQKIFFDWFTNSDYYNADASFWNCDSFNGSLSVDQIRKYLQPRYALYYKDYFTGIKRSYQSSPFFSSAAGKTTLHIPVSNNEDGNSNYNIQVTNLGSQPNPDLIGGFGQDPTNGSAASMRMAFALDKFYRRTIQAYDGSYASQIAAHYGYKMKHDPYKSLRLGSVTAPLNISEVVTTAETDEGKVGDLHGRGVSSTSDNDTITFDSNEHGIIIGLFHITPLSDYRSCMLDPFVTKLSFTDFFQPEFADLGLQPIPQYQASYEVDLSNDKFKNSPNVSLLGFTNRYCEYKTSVDKIHYPFYDMYRWSRLNKNSTEGSNPIHKLDKSSVFLPGSMSAWSIYRNVYPDVSGSLTPAFLFVDPSVTDTIVSVSYDGTPDTDFVVVDMNVECKAIRNMSVDGMPNL